MPGHRRRLPNGPSDDAPQPADDGPCALCALCSAGPEGRQGHPEMHPRLDQLGRRMKERLRLVFSCHSCEAKWVRERVARRQHRWIRVV
ncbi:MAG TPA: hypothetical protein VFP36_02915 [Usitatibacter sp.]|nr:hypothetical protein [Usitatibacter sp.]